MLPAIVPASEEIDRNNHLQRNALTPALSSVEMLEEYWKQMSPEQIQKCLRRIKDAIDRQMEMLEKDNRDIADGKVVVLRKKH